MKHVNNLAFRKELEMVFFVCEQDSQILNSFKGFFRMNSRIYLYIKPFQEGARLNGGPVYADAFEIF